MEVVCQMDIAKDLAYITSDTYNTIKQEAEPLGKMISGNIRALNAKP